MKQFATLTTEANSSETEASKGSELGSRSLGSQGLRGSAFFWSEGLSWVIIVYSVRGLLSALAAEAETSS